MHIYMYTYMYIYTHTYTYIQASETRKINYIFHKMSLSCSYSANLLKFFQKKIISKIYMARLDVCIR